MKNKFLLFLLLVLTGVQADPVKIDPTRPPASEADPKDPTKKAASTDLTAIFIYGNMKFAIIGGNVSKIGDKMGEFTITDITPYTVELEGPQNSRQTLQLLVEVKQRNP